MPPCLWGILGLEFASVFGTDEEALESLGTDGAVESSTKGTAEVLSLETEKNELVM